MAQRRSSRAGSARRSSRSSRSQSSNNTPMILGVAAGVIVVVLIAVMAGGGGGKGGDSQAGASGAGDSSKDRTTQPAAQPDSGGGSSARLHSAADQPGKTPDRAAPTITDEALSKAQKHYEAAKVKWNDGQRLRSKGADGYTDAIKEAFTEIEASRDALRTYTDWMEEADFGDWAMPGSYVALRKRLGVYDKLYQKIKKVKQIR